MATFPGQDPRNIHTFNVLFPRFHISSFGILIPPFSLLSPCFVSHIQADHFPCSWTEEGHKCIESSLKMMIIFGQQINQMNWFMNQEKRKWQVFNFLLPHYLLLWILLTAVVNLFMRRRERERVYLLFLGTNVKRVKWEWMKKMMTHFNNTIKFFLIYFSPKFFSFSSSFSLSSFSFRLLFRYWEKESKSQMDANGAKESIWGKERERNKWRKEKERESYWKSALWEFIVFMDFVCMFV